MINPALNTEDDIRFTKQLLLLSLIIISAAISRFYGLDRLSLWGDELWVVMESSRGSLSEMLRHIYYSDNHPPGYYLLSRYSQLLLGSSDYAIRFPAAIAGALLVLATFIVGRKHFSVETAFIASALVSGAYQAIYYSQEARANIFVALFALLAFHYFWSIVARQEHSPKNFVAFWICSTLINYLHYAGLVFTCCLPLIYLVLFFTDRKKYTPTLLFRIFLPPALLFAPWLPTMHHHLVYGPPDDWLIAPDLREVMMTFWCLFGPDDFITEFYKVIFFASLVFLVILLFRKPPSEEARGQRALLWCTLAVFLLPMLVFYIKSHISQPAFNCRHFLYAIPFMALLAAHWLSQPLRLLPKTWQSTFLIIMVIAIIIFQNMSNINRKLYRAGFFKAEYRDSAYVVRNDKNFLAKNDITILSSSPFFDHYLRQISNDPSMTSLKFETDQNVNVVRTQIADKNITEFYFLEESRERHSDMVTSRDLLLAQYYLPICREKFVFAQAIKFRVTPVIQPIDITALPRCPFG